jgi:hypothetical protein
LFRRLDQEIIRTKSSSPTWATQQEAILRNKQGRKESSREGEKRERKRKRKPVVYFVLKILLIL